MAAKLNLRLLITLSVIFSLIIFNSCRDKNYTIAKANVPIYQKKSDWRNTNFNLEVSQGPSKTGKIYLYEDLLLIVEPYQGVHFYDNSNSSNPLLLGWIPILACTDVSVRNDILYANSYYDLIAINIANLSNPILVDRLEDVFQFYNYSMLPGFDENFPMAALENNNDQVIVGWTVMETEIPTQSANNFHTALFETTDMNILSSESGNSIGIGGSMAQFSIVNDYLYTLMDNELESYELTANGSMNSTSAIQIQRTCETLFGTQNYLFMGTTSGMLVYDLTSPATPEFTSEVNHITSCDPVVVIGNRAYITLSSESDCWGVNQLEVINIDNIQAPELIAQYGMDNPKGLGVESNILFVCDGSTGVKIFDRSDDYQITSNLLTTLPVINAKDVIPYNKNLIITADDGVYQYDYQDVNNIYQTSHIPLNN